MEETTGRTFTRIQRSCHNNMGGGGGGGGGGQEENTGAEINRTAIKSRSKLAYVFAVKY